MGRMSDTNSSAAALICFSYSIKSGVYSLIVYAGELNRTTEPCVPVTVTETAFVVVAKVAGLCGKSLELFTTDAVWPLGRCTCKNGAPVEGVKSTWFPI